MTNRTGWTRSNRAFTSARLYQSWKVNHERSERFCPAARDAHSHNGNHRTDLGATTAEAEYPRLYATVGRHSSFPAPQLTRRRP